MATKAQRIGTTQSEIGTTQSDKWLGTSGNDSFNGLAGNDICIAGKGDDKVDGGAGKDKILGGGGGDTIVGGAGNDVLMGGAGDDDITGGAGKDIIRGGAGDDTIEGNSGKDRITGDAGDDNIDGGSGNDQLSGGEGNDFVIGGTGNDLMLGDAGDDTLDWNDGDGNDIMSGGDGLDTIEVDGSVARGDNFVLGKNAAGKAFFERVGLDGQPVGQFNLTVDTAEVFDVSGEGGNDTFIVNDLTGTGVELVQFDGGVGNDTLNAENSGTRIEAVGGEGDDVLGGSSSNDTLSGDNGNDVVVGNKGDDVMLGGAGDDTLDWDDGDGNDIMSGGDGLDTIEVDGSVARGDNFVLGKNAAGKAFFERVGLDGQPVGRFNLTVDTAEIFDVSGDGGNDTFIVNDLTGTGVDLIQFDGGAGNDLLDARNSSTRVVAVGGDGDDTLIGGTGTIVGVNNVTLGDTLTGGLGKDKFQFSTNPFANGNPAVNLNQPDVITDYEIGVDQILLDKLQTGISVLKFQNGSVDQLSGDNNLLVLQGGFANAGAAAAAIKNNQNITAVKGAFVYFNQTLGFSRVVFSQDLANGGAFSVQANLTNQTNQGNQANFSAADFGLV